MTTLQQSQITIPQRTIKDYADLKADGQTTFVLGLNDDAEVILEITSADETSKDGYRTCVNDSLEGNYVHAAFVHALTGNDGQLKWVLLTWVNTTVGTDEFDPGQWDWSGVGPWVAEQLGGITKVLDLRSVDFENPAYYSTAVAPAVADL